MEKVIKNLLMAVYTKIYGWSLEDTKTYYRNICKKAWNQVEEANTPELKSQLLDQELGWIMVEGDEEEKIARTFENEEVTLPSWWWRLGNDLASYNSERRDEAVEPEPRQEAAAGSRESSYDRKNSRTNKSSAVSNSYSAESSRKSGSINMERPVERMRPAVGSPKEEKKSPAMPVLPGAAQAAVITAGVKDFGRSLSNNIKGFSAKLFGDPAKVKMLRRKGQLIKLP